MSLQFYAGNSRKQQIYIDPFQGSAPLQPFNFLTGKKLIQTGWESGIILTPETPSTHFTDISGIDNSVAFPNNWGIDLKSSGVVKSSRIWYEDGTDEQRIAEIVDSPKAGDGQGKTLHFQLSDTNVSIADVRTKGRVQHTFQNITGISEFLSKNKMLLPPHMANLRSYPGTFKFFTIAEFWNDEGTDTYPFRVTVSIRKTDSAVGAPLRFFAHGQEKVDGSWPAGTIWEETNNTFEVPDDQWLSMEYYFFEGGEPDSGNPVGRFTLIVTPEGGEPQVIFDINRCTRHRSQPSPNGFSGMQPHKLYVGVDVIDHMIGLEQTIDLYFDDFEFWYQD